MKLILFPTALALVVPPTMSADYIAYDNTINYEQSFTSRSNIEVGDEINLIGGAATMTRFQFEYYATPGTPVNASGIVRFYDMKEVSIPREQPFQPGNLLFESQPFQLLDGFHQGSIDDLSLDVPGRFVWTVSFSGVPENGSSFAGLLFYNGVEVGGDPGQSFDDHWEYFTPFGQVTPQ